MKLGRAQSIIIEQLPKRRTRHREARTDFLPIKKDDEAAVGCRVEQVKVEMLCVFFDTDDCKEPILLPCSMFVMFHVVVFDFLLRFSLDSMVLYIVVVYFQVSGPAQRRTWTSIEDRLFLENPLSTFTS